MARCKQCGFRIRGNNFITNIIRDKEGYIVSHEQHNTHEAGPHHSAARPSPKQIRISVQHSKIRRATIAHHLKKNPNYTTGRNLSC